MDINEAIAELAEKLDKWLDGSLSTLRSDDLSAQSNAILRGVAIARELDQLKADGMAALRSLLTHPHTMTSNERVTPLIQAFEFAAKLKAALHDELLDTDGYNKIVVLMNEIAAELDRTAEGRHPLGVLLDRPDAAVRASAGAYLVDVMPDRAVPVLREIDQKEGGSSADFTAHWALLDWEMKQKRATEGKQS